LDGSGGQPLVRIFDTAVKTSYWFRKLLMCLAFTQYCQIDSPKSRSYTAPQQLPNNEKAQQIIIICALNVSSRKA
jgi:hypothetical protein